MSSCYIHLCACLSAPLLPQFRLYRIPNHAYTALQVASSSTHALTPFRRLSRKSVLFATLCPCPPFSMSLFFIFHQENRVEMLCTGQSCVFVVGFICFQLLVFQQYSQGFFWTFHFSSGNLNILCLSVFHVLVSKTASCLSSVKLHHPALALFRVSEICPTLALGMAIAAIWLPNVLLVSRLGPQTGGRTRRKQGLVGDPAVTEIKALKEVVGTSSCLFLFLLPGWAVWLLHISTLVLYHRPKPQGSPEPPK